MPVVTLTPLECDATVLAATGVCKSYVATNVDSFARYYVDDGAKCEIVYDERGGEWGSQPVDVSGQIQVSGDDRASIWEGDG